MAFGDSIGLLFTLKAKDEASRVVTGAAGHIKGEVKELDSTVGRLGQAFGLTNTQAASFARALPVVGAAAGALGAVVVGAGTALFTLAKTASDAGSVIFDLKAKTGLGAESLSALKFAAEQSGSSIEEAAQAFVIYQNKLTDAAAKGRDLFGIDARKALGDQEFALRELVTLLNGPVPAGYSRSSLAAELMGRSGSNLIATFDTMGASFDRFIEQARRMGVVLTEEDVRAADEFGDTLTVLGAQLSAVANKMALQFAPEMTKGMRAVGEEATRSKDIIVSAGRLIGEAIGGQVDAFNQLAFSVRAVRNLLAGLPAGTALTAAAAAGLPSVGEGDETAPGSRTGGFDAGNAVRINPATMRPYRTAEEMQRERDKAARESERAATKAQGEAEREGERQKAVVKALADEYARLGLQVKNYYEMEVEQRIAQMRLSSGVETLTGNRREQAEQLLNLIANELRHLDTMERLKESVKESERIEEEAAEKQEAARLRVRDAIREQITALAGEESQLEKVNRLIKESEALEAIDARTAAWLRQLAALNDVASKMQEVTPVGGDVMVPQAPGQEGGPRVDPATVGPAPDFSPWQQAVAGLREMTVGSFKAIGQAMGQAAAAAVVHGQSFGKAMKTAVTATLAGIAAESFVRALFETAKGIAALAGFMPGPAALHFKAAAMFAAVGAATGVAGAAIAGIGGGGGAAVAGSSFSSSSTETRDRTVREGRRGGAADPNVAQPVAQVNVTLQLDRDVLEKQSIDIWEGMGPYRDRVMASTTGTAPSY